MEAYTMSDSVRINMTAEEAWLLRCLVGCLKTADSGTDGIAVGHAPYDHRSSSNANHTYPDAKRVLDVGGKLYSALYQCHVKAPANEKWEPYRP